MSLLVEEKQQWSEMRGVLEQRCLAAEEDSRKLKEENDILRRKLQFLQHEVSTSDQLVQI